MLKTYTKKSELSYAFGVAPTIELLEQRVGEVVKVLVSPKGNKNTGLSKILALCEKNNIDVEYNQDVIEKLTSTENTYALGAFKKYKTNLAPHNNHVVLVKPSDMGNLGTICRTMLAFNVTDLAIIKPGVDVFDPKVIRASMGALFSLNVVYVDSLEDYQRFYNQNLYVITGNGKEVLNKVTFKPPFSLVFGNEGEGLTAKYLGVGTSVKIPQSAKVDSLNLATAVGIVLYKGTQY